MTSPCKRHRGTQWGSTVAMLWKNSQTTLKQFSQKTHGNSTTSLARQRWEADQKKRTKKRSRTYIPLLLLLLILIFIHLGKPFKRAIYHVISAPAVWASSASSGAAWSVARLIGYPWFLGAQPTWRPFLVTLLGCWQRVTRPRCESRNAKVIKQYPDHVAKTGFSRNKLRSYSKVKPKPVFI